MTMFITDAYAQAASGASQGGLVGLLLPFALIIPIFYLLVFRPQNKKIKEHKALIAAVKRGDRVITSSGLIGQVNKVIDDNEVQLEIAEGVRVRMLRASISEIVTRAEPAKTAQDNSADKKSDGR
jgi:preprotein translocase subunit YajC